MSSSLRVVSYNIHKGFSVGNRRLVSEGIRTAVHEIEPTLVFLQEVVGQNDSFGRKFSDWPTLAQHEYFGSEALRHRAYGKNAVYREGHHGNAILSQHPFLMERNIDASVFDFEPRGFLHVHLPLPGNAQGLHALCIHLGLIEYERRLQARMIRDYVREHVPGDAPLVVAGDFNDWRCKLHPFFEQEMGLSEAFESAHGRVVKSFPAALPFWRLDRVYYKNLEVSRAECRLGAPWKKLSDHLPLVVEFNY